MPESYWNKNKEELLEYHKRYREANREKINARQRVYRLGHLDEIKASRKNRQFISNEYERKRRREDPEFRLASNLRKRLRSAVAKNYKSGSAIADLGCSISELREYIAAKFLPGMTWNNYGEWHIDHIKPLSRFDLSDSNQLKEACHFSNLQPLWAFQNRSKSNR